MKGPTNSSARPNIRLLNVSATFDDNPDTSNNTEFPYRASIQADGVSEYMSATVMFSQIQATSGNFATYCQTDEDVVYIYSKTDVGTITIPAVSCDLSVNYINVDSVPTEDSQAVITSGGVYDALGDYVTKDTAQTITAEKTFTARVYSDRPHPYFICKSSTNDMADTTRAEYGYSRFAHLDKNDRYVGIHEMEYETNGNNTLVNYVNSSRNGGDDWGGIWIQGRTDGSHVMGFHNCRTDFGTVTHIGNIDSRAVTGGTVSADGWMTYIRTGPKCGFLNMGFKLTTTSSDPSLANDFVTIRTSAIESKLGITLKSNFDKRTTGVWWSNPIVDVDFGQYVSLTNSQLNLGRVYNNGSNFAWGGWPWSTLKDRSYMLTGIYIEEA